jgi:hypothetical protein
MIVDWSFFVAEDSLVYLLEGLFLADMGFFTALFSRCWVFYLSYGASSSSRTNPSSV